MADDEKLHYLLTALDFYIGEGECPTNAWNRALYDYNFVYHTDDGRHPVSRASEVILNYLAAKEEHERAGIMADEKLRIEDWTDDEIIKWLVSMDDYFAQWLGGFLNNASDRLQRATQARPLLDQTRKTLRIVAEEFIRFREKERLVEQGRRNG